MSFESSWWAFFHGKDKTFADFVSQISLIGFLQLTASFDQEGGTGINQCPSQNKGSFNCPSVIKSMFFYHEKAMKNKWDSGQTCCWRACWGGAALSCCSCCAATACSCWGGTKLLLTTVDEVVEDWIWKSCYINSIAKNYDCTTYTTCHTIE